MSTPETHRVSVALCTHNGARFVGEQVRSILGQTLPVAQIVVGDDASDDATLQVVRDAVAAVGDHAPELIVLPHRPALGVVGNFESAIAAATGDLIALSDQDDTWHPEKVERLVAQFAVRPGLLLVHTNARLVDEHGAALGMTLFEALGVTRTELANEHEGRAFDALMRRNLVTGATTVFRSTLRDIAMPFDRAWVHDEWLAILAAAVGCVDVVESPLIDYRQHGANVIGASKPGPRELLSRLAEPRAARNARLLARAEGLVMALERLEGAADPSRLRAAREKLAHEQHRSALPAARVRRLGPILRAARSGAYGTYGRAKYDIVRDLLQPAW